MEGVAAGYEPGRPVLRDLSLRIDNDDRIALLGSNGNGKSTLSKILAERLSPLGGHDYPRAPSSRSAISRSTSSTSCISTKAPTTMCAP